MSGYQLRSLQLNGLDLPPSIPLIISDSYTWNKDTNTISILPEAETRSVGSVQLISDAIQMIQSIEKPIAVASIFGPLRSGKSYLLSKLHGKSNTFGLGHDMDPCTKGTWISTTVLENDKHAIIFLDTEGTDSVHSDDDDSGILSQLFIVILMSSVLIYNSKGAATASELEDLEFLSDFLKLLLENESEQEGLIKSSLPHFFWLLRDFHLECENRDGEPISVNDYITTEILNPENSEYADTIDTIRKMFPSIVGHSLCMPCSPDNLTNILENEEQLDRGFLDGVGELKELLLEKAPSRLTCKNGFLMAELLTRYFHLVQSNSEIILKDAYITSVEQVLQKTARKLTEEYTQEIEAFMDRQNIVETSTLMQFHKEVFQMKKMVFVKELDSFLSGESSKNIRLKHITMFESNISVIMSRENLQEIQENTVLYNLAKQNNKKSKKYCQQVFDEEFRSLLEEIKQSEQDREPKELKDSVKEAEQKYFSRAIGPAKQKVYKRNRKKIEKHCKAVAKIPGCPCGLNVVGRDKKRVKLCWETTRNNEDAVSYYEAEYSLDGSTWKEFPHKSGRQQLWAVIDGLDSKCEYYFRVRGHNEEVGFGNWSEHLKTMTTVGYLQQGTVTVGAFITGVVITPVVALASMFVLGPIGPLVTAAAAPVTSAIFANEVRKYCGPTGEFADSNPEN